MNIKKLAVCTNNLEQTATFYTEILQLQILDQSENSISFLTGESILTFNQDDQIIQPVYHIAFNIPENQLAPAITWAKERIELLPVTADSKIADFDLWKAESVYFYDNNNNLMEFIVRHDLGNPSGEPFSGKAIDCISEIGIVTNDVAVCADQLIDQYGIPVFAKQPRQNQFVVLGDDKGLLVLVEKGRNWFPTQVPADSFPAIITIQQDKGKQEQIITLPFAQ